MVIEMIKSSTFWLNAFPPKGGISDTVSPHELLTGIKIDYNKHCKLQFGSYIQTHEENNPTNSMDSRTIGAIALGPSSNLQGGYKFMNLYMGCLITWHRWMPLPMPKEVIDMHQSVSKG